MNDEIKGCAFCRGYGVFLKDQGASLSFEDGNSLRLTQDEINTQKQMDVGVAVIIHYCPFCGRKLGDHD